MKLRSSIFALFSALLVASAAFAETGLKLGGTTHFKVELTPELRNVAGRSQPSPVTHALVAISVPENFDAARDWPVMVVSATSDPGAHSSRLLLGAYAETARAAGWVLVAADPTPEVPVPEDEVALRYVLNIAALAALTSRWPGAAKAPLAFGGFSGGSKFSGWLAAAFANEGRTVIGIYVAGMNENVILSAAQDFKVLNERYKRIPVFLQSGDRDEGATPTDHRRIQAELKSAGFKNVRVEYFHGEHDEDAGPLRLALDWFRELAGTGTP